MEFEKERNGVATSSRGGNGAGLFDRSPFLKESFFGKGQPPGRVSLSTKCGEKSKWRNSPSKHKKKKRRGERER